MKRTERALRGRERSLDPAAHSSNGACCCRSSPGTWRGTAGTGWAPPWPMCPLPLRVCVRVWFVGACVLLVTWFVAVCVLLGEWTARPEEGYWGELGPSHRPQFQLSMLLQKLPGYMEGDSMDRLGASMADVSFATQGVCVCLRIWLVGVCVLLVM